MIDVQHEAAVAMANRILKQLEGAMSTLVDQVRAAAAAGVAELEARVADLEKQVANDQERITALEDEGDER